jgi:uncharacterized protein (TIGR03382 family)
LAQSNLLLYDGFAYPNGELLAPITDTTATPTPGQHNVEYDLDWRYAGAGTANTNPPGITTGSLSTPGLQASTGNSVLYDTTQLAAARINIPTAPSSGTVYWSGLFKMNDVDNLTTGGALGQGSILIAGFNNGQGPGGIPSTMGAVLIAKKDGTDAGNTKYFLGTSVNTGNANRVFLPTTSEAGDTLFVVASYTINGGSADDEVRLWVNPDTSTFGAATAPTETLFAPLVSGSDPLTPVTGGVASFTVRNVNSVGNPACQCDELRGGLDWASVTPAAGAAPLLGDYNDDHTVNAADLTVWQGSYGMTGASQPADGNGDSVVDGADFLIWQTNLGNSNLPISAVPEPASGLLALSLAAALGLVRRRK